MGLGPVLLFPMGAGAQQEYRVDLAAERQARFLSRTVIQEFDGVTERIEGLAFINTPSLAEDTRGEDTEIYFEVDVGTLDTGISLRNRHMRDNYLEVEEFPFAAFGGQIVLVEPLPEGSFRVIAEGVFGVHGIERERTIECEVEPEAEWYHVLCAFEVLLSDHQIEIPRIMFLELNNQVRVEVDFFLVPVEVGNE